MKCEIEGGELAQETAETGGAGWFRAEQLSSLALSTDGVTESQLSGSSDLPPTLVCRLFATKSLRARATLAEPIEWTGAPGSLPRQAGAGGRTWGTRPVPMGSVRREQTTAR